LGWGANKEKVEGQGNRLGGVPPKNKKKQIRARKKEPGEMNINLRKKIQLTGGSRKSKRLTRQIKGGGGK